MIKNRLPIIILSALLMFSCRGKKGDVGLMSTQEEDRAAKAQLQGIWVDDDSEDVLFRMKGDSVFYPDSTSMPVAFRVIGDTLVLSDNDDTHYYVEKRAAHLLWFRSNTGDIVKLHKSDNPADSLLFVRNTPQILTLNEVVKRDSVMMYDGNRYHCYVYVNPTRKKVRATSYTDEGIKVSNVYYDNVIHICVYEGANCVYSRDYSKSDFIKVVPSTFIPQSILTNMVIRKADSKGCHFYATLASTNSSSYYMVDVTIDYRGKRTLSLVC